MECTTISCLHPADEIMLSVLFGAKTAIRKTWCHLPDFRFSGSPHNFRIASIYYCSSLSRNGNRPLVYDVPEVYHNT